MNEFFHTKELTDMTTVKLEGLQFPGQPRPKPAFFDLRSVNPPLVMPKGCGPSDTTCNHEFVRSDESRLNRSTTSRVLNPHNVLLKMRRHKDCPVEC